MNTKDHPVLPSGYGNIAKHLAPRLYDHYGKDSLVLYCPVYSRDRIETWNNIKILPGVSFDFGEQLILEHYKYHERNLLLQVGDFAQLKEIPRLAALDEIVWVQWGPVDFLSEPEWIKDLLRYPLKNVSFSQYGENRLRKMGLSNVHKAIWIGVDTNIWRPIDRLLLTSVMHSLGFAEDSFNILVAQANQRRKNLQETFAGISMFNEIYPEAKTRVYLHTWASQGEADMTVLLEDAHLTGITNVTAPYLMMNGGYTEDQLVKIYNCADVAMDVCLEGFGMGMLQAQAVGTPVIGMLEGPAPEIVRSGVLVPTHHVDYGIPLNKPVADPVHIADALLTVYDNKGKRSQAAMEHARANFDWDKIAQEWIECIDEIMDMQERFTLYIPSPSKTLKRRARKLVEIG